MIAVPLTQGKVALIDDDDAGLVRGYRWYALRHCRTWYAITNVRRADGGKTKLRLHQLIAGPPPGAEVDHRDGDGLNNQRANLRICTHAENMRNKRPHRGTTSGFKGVTYARRNRKWRSRLRVNGRCIALGLHATAEAAALAYDDAARAHFGPFARLNFPGRGEEARC